jgi:hypothetical protein
MPPVFAASRRVSMLDHWLTLSLAMPGKTRTRIPTMYVADRHLQKEYARQCVHVTFKRS